ncbi:MAG: polysaccharide biosynthesis protein [Clostridia bacterium]|nr:polysaccharide biosynthesis protein [Clostridia bacterium]
MSRKVDQLKSGALLSYLQMALNIGISLVYTPLMIRLLGKSEYGLYNTVASTISALSILSLGFNSSYIRYFAKYKASGDRESISKLNGLFLIIFVIIGLVALACGGFLSGNLDIVFDDGLTASEYSVARILMLLLTVNLAISFPMSVFSNIISANERFVVLKLLGMVRTVVGPMVSIPVLLLGFRSVALVVITLAVSLLTDVLYVAYVFGPLKNRFVFHGFERGLFASLFTYTGFIAVNLIVDQINWNLGKLLLGRFRGTESVAVYSVGYMIYHYYMTFSTSVSGVFTPRIHNIVNTCRDDRQRRDRELTELFVKVGRIQFLLLGLIASGLVFFGRQFIAFWAGEGYGQAYPVMLLLVLPASIALIQNLGIEVQRAENNHRFRSIVYIVMAIINLVLSVFLIKAYGEVGAAIGTAVSLVVANGLIMNIYYHKKCGLDILLFWKNIVRASLGLAAPIAAGIVLPMFFDYTAPLQYVCAIALYTVVYALSMWLVGMNRYEKELCLKPIGRLLKRGRRA